MVITDQFIYIHPPKTGGTFVTDSLLKLYGAKWDSWKHLRAALFGGVEWNGRFGAIRMQDKHGSCRNIPEKFRNRPVFSTLRSPWDYYVSDYEFGWWKRRQWMPYYRAAPDAEQLLQGFPDISFGAYLRLTAGAFNKPSNRQFDEPDQLGYYTTSFIHFFFRNLHAAGYCNQSPYFREERFREDLYPVDFLTTRSLNRQLYEYLLGLGFAETDLAFILHKKKVLPQGKGRTRQQKWQQYYTEELKALVRQKDDLIFRLAPQFADQT